MRNVIFILVVLLFSCNSEKDERQERRKLFHNYADSAMKYMKIDNECGVFNANYYNKLSDSIYLVLYPKGNPAKFDSVPPPPPPDTICYPINPSK